MKDQDKSQEEVQSIVNAWWFKFALFGGATVLMALVAKSALLTGVALGMGIMSFFTHFGKRPTPAK